MWSFDTEQTIYWEGGTLNPENILIAYQQGFFPWPQLGAPLRWWHPAERCLLFPSQFHLSSRNWRALRPHAISGSVDHAFEQVIVACATQSERHLPANRWITPEMIEAYCHLHQQGYAHSFELYSQGRLCGGLYGLSLGGAFFGESMFSTLSNSSKMALASLMAFATQHNFLFVDCQISSDHLRSLGAVNLPRTHFLQLLAQSNRCPTLQGSWSW